MSRNFCRIVMLFLALVVLTACNRGEDAAIPTLDVEATVAAAVAATTTDQSQMQAAIDDAVQATATAMAATAALTPTPTTGGRRP